VRESYGPQEAGKAVSGPAIDQRVIEPLYAWRDSGRVYPAVNLRFFATLGIGLEPTDEAVDAVCDFIEDPHIFQEALFNVMDDPASMRYFEQLLELNPGELARISAGLKLVVLNRFIEDAEEVLMIDSYL
jgi:hypothetical protein